MEQKTTDQIRTIYLIAQTEAKLSGKCELSYIFQVPQMAEVLTLK